MRTITGLILVCVAVVGMGQSAAPVTIWDGVYTEAQARRGQGAYDASCASCHQSDLSGGGVFEDDQAPPLRNFEIYVARRDMNNLFTYVKDRMPADARGSLLDTTYADVLAYLLEQNDVPAGREELRPEAARLRGIAIVRRTP
jgi:mono/diheme cytochrome c family protein